MIGNEVEGINQQTMNRLYKLFSRANLKWVVVANAITALALLGISFFGQPKVYILSTMLMAGLFTVTSIYFCMNRWQRIIPIQGTNEETKPLPIRKTIIGTILTVLGWGIISSLTFLISKTFTAVAYVDRYSETGDWGYYSEETLAYCLLVIGSLAVIFLLAAIVNTIEKMMQRREFAEFMRTYYEIMELFITTIIAIGIAVLSITFILDITK